METSPSDWGGETVSLWVIQSLPSPCLPKRFENMEDALTEMDKIYYELNPDKFDGGESKAE
jgi:hypothetical protein